MTPGPSKSPALVATKLREPQGASVLANNTRVAEGLVFVCGLQRSGTTLLSRILSDGPEAAGLVGTHTNEDEGQFIQDVFENDHALGLRRGSFRGVSERWARNPAAHLTEAHASAIPFAEERLLASWWPFWSDHTARHFIEKSPSNLVRTRFLQSLFPDSRFIVITRHPVAQALAIRKWGPYPRQLGFGMAVSIEHWLTGMELFAQDRPYLRNCLVLSYEDLRNSPAKTLRLIADFSGIAGIEHGGKRIEGGPDRYAEQWNAIREGRALPQGSFVRTDRSTPADRMLAVANSAVARTYGVSQARRLEARFSSRLARFGYSFEEPSYCWAGSTTPDESVN